MPLESLNILPILDWFTRIDDLLRSINSKLEYIERPVREIARVENVSVGKGYTDILYADITNFKTKTLSIRLDRPMDILVYLYDRESDIDYDDPYILMSKDDIEDKTVTITITDLYRFVRVGVYNFNEMGVVKVCSLKGSIT